MKYIKKITAIVLAIVMTVTLIPIYNIKADTVTSGTCGATGNESNVTWNFDSSTGTLTISGTGAMADYNENSSKLPPWWMYKKQVKSIIISDGITEIGMNSFCGYTIDNLTLPTNSLTDIHFCAFANSSSSNNFTELKLPDSVIYIGDENFRLFKCNYFKTPENLSYIRPGALPNAKLLEINEGITQISNYTLNSNRVILPSTITSLGNDIGCSFIYGKNEYTKTWATANGYKYIDATQTYDIKNVVATYDNSFEYTGSEIKPILSLVYNHENDVTATLIENVDYTIKYSNNINLGTATATITGIGAYTGTKTITYSIISTLVDDDASL